MKSAYAPINEQLNSMSIYKDKKCQLCERSYPDTILNIEEAIHHNHPNKPYYRCVNLQDCNKYKKKHKI